MTPRGRLLGDHGLRDDEGRRAQGVAHVRTGFRHQHREDNRQALRAYAKGDPEPVLALWSHRDDVTLANPFGPPCRGRSEIESATRQAVANFQPGGPLYFREVSSSFDEVARCASTELGYVVQLERHEGTLAEREGSASVALRVTMIFRHEDDGWKVVHRHADPVTAPPAPEQ